MFFATPEVKTLSKYSEFGSHNTRPEFLVTFIITLMLHLGIVGIYSMSPREETVKIPVRVLNIKFSGDSAGDEEEQQGGGPKMEQNMPFDASQNGAGIGSKHSTENDKNQVIEIINKGVSKIKTQKEEDTAKESSEVVKPKKYYRDSEIELNRNGKAKGNGTGITGSREGEDIVRNYQQQISLLVEKSKGKTHVDKNINKEGKVLVRIRINKEGNILFKKIETSSGDEFLDKEALEMIDNTSKLPAFPENYTEEEMEFLLPVSFILQ